MGYYNNSHRWQQPGYPDSPNNAQQQGYSGGNPQNQNNFQDYDPAGTPTLGNFPQNNAPSYPPAGYGFSSPEEPQPPQEETANKDYGYRKICFCHTKNQSIDFRNRLVPAKEEEFDMVHGCGGSGHAYNSTIECVLCDHSKGTGSSSTTVSFKIDVHDIEILYEAAKRALFGELNDFAGLLTACNNTLSSMRGWLTNNPSYPDGTYSVHSQEVVDTGQQLKAAMFNQSWDGYRREKNNPYKQVNGIAPVSKISITFKGVWDDGTVAGYPWRIFIENFSAPVKTWANGSVSHNSKEATNYKSAAIKLSTADFFAMMLKIRTCVRQWEAAQLDTFKAGLKTAEEQRRKFKGE